MCSFVHYGLFELLLQLLVQLINVQLRLLLHLFDLSFEVADLLDLVVIGILDLFDLVVALLVDLHLLLRVEEICQIEETSIQALLDFREDDMKFFGLPLVDA